MSSDVSRLRATGSLVDSLGAAIRNGEADLANVPGLVLKLTGDNPREGPWREFETQMGRHVSHDSFEEFVTTQPLAGLGCASVRQLTGLCTDDVPEGPRAREAITRACQRDIGVNQHSEGFDNIQTLAPTGTSESAALRRLRKDRPDLLERVLSGELKAHAAMIEAGFRPRTVTVRVADPESAARTLRNGMTEEDRLELARLLNELHSVAQAAASGASVGMFAHARDKPWNMKWNPTMRLTTGSYARH